MLLQETVVQSALRFFERAIVRYRDDVDLQDLIDFIQAEVRQYGIHEIVINQDSCGMGEATRYT